MRRDGSLVDRPGYDPESKLFFLPPEGFELSEIPERPTKKQVREAYKRLNEAFEEFPFDSPVNHTNALALLPAIGLRHLIPGSVPAFGFTATEIGTGKTKLAALPYLILNGNPVPISSWPTERDADAEVRKVLTANLLSGAPFLLFDNLSQAIQSESLAAMLTGSGYRDRVLGESRTVEINEMPVVAFTGNHLMYGRDIARRFCTIKLDAKVPRPADRTGFKHPDLEQYVLENRPQLLADFFTISRYWAQKGMPRGKTGARREDNFRDFVGLVSGWLELVGRKGFHTNVEDAQSLYDDEAGEWAVFLDKIYGWSKGREFKVGQLAQAIVGMAPGADPDAWEQRGALRDSIPPTCRTLHDALQGPSTAPLESRLGWQFKNRAGTRYETDDAEFWLECRAVGGSKSWRVHRKPQRAGGG
jgi:hypothetical protein